MYLEVTYNGPTEKSSSTRCLARGTLHTRRFVFCAPRCRKEFSMKKRKEKGPIATLTGLLVLMGSEYGTRKTGATLLYSRLNAATEDEIIIREYFDDGKGHPGAFTDQTTLITREVFERALENRYISGILKPGYVSNWEFSITDFGQRAFAERVPLLDRAVNLLYKGKGMRACDLQLGLPVPEELVADVLEWLVYDGYAESYEHGEQRFYLRTR